MKKLLLGIVFVGLLAVVSFKGFILYQVYGQLEQIKEQVAPHAMLKYRWIFSTFDGEVGVSGIEITPYLLKGVVTIDEVSLKTEDALSLIKLSEMIGRGQLPDQLGVRVSNLSFPVESDVAGFIESLGDDEALAMSNDQFNPFGIYACGDTSFISGKELKAMGYNQFTFSSELKYYFSPLDRALNVSAMVDSDSMGRSDITIDLGLKDNQLNTLLSSAEIPDINSAQWALNDGGYYRRLSFYCAKKSTIDRAQYVDDAAQEWDADLQDHGVMLNRSLVDAYRRYILDGGLLSINIQPEAGIDYAVLPLFSVNDLIAMLNLKVELNGEVLPDLSIVVESAEKPALLSVEPPQSATVDAQEPTSAVPQAKLKQYVEIGVDAIGDHIKHRVWIELNTGKQLEGVIISVDDNVVEVERSMAGGVVSYPLQKQSITLVKVWQ